MDFILPDIGEGIETISVSEILIKENQEIKANESVLLVETDKASMEIPSEVDGVISKVHVSSGDKISPNDLILSIEIPNSNKTKDDEILVPSEEIQTSATSSKQQDGITDNNSLGKSNKKMQEIDFSKVLASPSTRKLARDLGCDINLIKGSGDNSRITREDVLKYVNQHLSSGETSI